MALTVDMGAFLGPVALRMGTKDLIDLVALELNLEAAPGPVELKEDTMSLKYLREVAKDMMIYPGVLVVGGDMM